MCSAAKPSISTANIEILEKLGFEERGRKDSRIFAATLSMLMNSIPDQTENLSKYYKRSDATNESVQKILEYFKEIFFCDESFDFDDICSKVFSYIFKMCKKPDVISQEIILEIYEKLVKIDEELRKEHVAGLDGDGLSQPLTQVPVLPPTMSQSSQIGKQKDPLLVNSCFLIRFVFMIGYVAMRELIYLDIDVYSNLKYRQEIKDQQKHNKNNKNLNVTMSGSAMGAKRKTITPNESAASAKRLSEIAPQNPEETEEDLIGATADDTVADQITLIGEKEILYSAESLLRRFVPMVTEILKFPQKFKSPELQQTAVLSLIRIMSISSVFCEDNIPFLMNVFQHSKNIKIKCNIIIGMSDFTFRFPNVIEPWSGQLYSTLHEKDNELRLTAVKILAHLISHEMILVKGQISDLALCLVDEKQEIRVITEQFFKEIANKSNILYNTLPDIISRLSDPNLNLEEAKYQLIMKHIIGLVNKDRQVESLVEKLCFRFKITVQERQWRDIAYCLSLLSYNEKTVKKLIENVKFFKDKVQVQEVYDSFRMIISNTLKLAKPELKVSFPT
jgi:condensin complex subunit 1